MNTLSFPTTQPMQHQARTLEWASNKRRAMLWHDVGIGKSFTSLHFMRMHHIKPVLIVCPNSVMEGWKDEIKKHTGKKARLLTGSMEARCQRLDKGTSSNTYWVTSYETLPYLGSALIDAAFPGVILDEVHWCSNVDAQRTRVCIELSKKAKACVGMTGTPISTSEFDLFAQYLAVGLTPFGGNPAAFRAARFDPPQHRYGHWTIKGKKARSAILRDAKRYTSRFAAADCVDLPPLSVVKRFCDPTKEQVQAMADLLSGDLLRKLQAKPSPKAVTNIGMKLAQIAGGFLLVDGKAVHLGGGCPRLFLLDDVLKETPGKVIVFHAFVEEGRWIESDLTLNGVPHVSLRGETRDKTCWRQFLGDPAIRVLVTHPLSGGTGLNLQGAQTVVFYSRGCWGAHIRQQAIGRVWRAGQDKPCRVIDLLVRGTIDEARLETARSRSAMVRKILSWAAKNS